IGIGGANSGQLSDEVEVATRISLLRGDAHAELLARFGESVKTALAEVVVDVEEPETLQVRHFLIDEIDHIADELAVRHRRAKYPFIALRGDALRGPTHNDLRHLFLAKDLRRAKPRPAPHPPHRHRHLLP